MRQGGNRIVSNTAPDSEHIFVGCQYLSHIYCLYIYRKKPTSKYSIFFYFVAFKEMSWVTICWSYQIKFCISMFSHTEGLKFSKILASRCLECSASSWLSLYLGGESNKKNPKPKNIRLTYLWVLHGSIYYIFYILPRRIRMFSCSFMTILYQTNTNTHRVWRAYLRSRALRERYSHRVKYSGTQRRPSPPILEDFLSAVVSMNSGVFLQLSSDHFNMSKKARAWVEKRKCCCSGVKISRKVFRGFLGFFSTLH